MFQRPTSTVPRHKTLACPRSLDRPPGKRFGSHILWLHVSALMGILLSNSLCLRTSRPNIDPHSVIGLCSGAPTTFSMIHAPPHAVSFWRVASIKSSYLSARFGRQFPYFVKHWQGGNVHANNFKPGARYSYPCTASTTKQIQAFKF